MLIRTKLVWCFFESFKILARHDIGTNICMVRSSFGPRLLNLIGRQQQIEKSTCSEFSHISMDSDVDSQEMIGLKPFLYSHIDRENANTIE